MPYSWIMEMLATVSMVPMKKPMVARTVASQPSTVQKGMIDSVRASMVDDVSSTTWFPSLGGRDQGSDQLGVRGGWCRTK